MTLRTSENNANFKRKHKISLSGGLALEEAMQDVMNREFYDESS
jgi:hypothetical protein